MLANNETGVIQPVAEAAALVHAAGGLLHVDAVQGPGRIACDFKGLGADLMTLSSHKIGGPQGVGALIKRDGLAVEPQIKGGGQERGARAGTENVAGIAGFGAAANAARQGWTGEAARMAVLRDKLEAGIRAIAANAVIFGERVARLPNTTLFAVPGMKAETAVIALRSRGRCGVLRLGVFVRKGRPLARAGRDGGATELGTRRNPRKSRLCNLRWGCWDHSKGLGEALRKAYIRQETSEKSPPRALRGHPTREPEITITDNPCRGP